MTEVEDRVLWARMSGARSASSRKSKPTLTVTDTGWLAVLAPTSTEGAVLMPPSDMRLAARLATSALLGSGSTARRAASAAAELTTV